MELLLEEWSVTNENISISPEVKALMERAGVGGHAASAFDSAQLAEIGIVGSGFGFDYRNSMRLFIVDVKGPKHGVDICEVLVGQQKRGSSKVEPIVQIKANLSNAAWLLIEHRLTNSFNEILKESKRKIGQWKKKGKTPVEETLGKELLCLAWALSDIPSENVEQIERAVLNWSSLAREERWWLYLKADSGGENTTHGWRKALSIALLG